MRSEVGFWFAMRRATALSIVAAETHASRVLTRIAYEPSDVAQLLVDASGGEPRRIGMLQQRSGPR